MKIAFGGESLDVLLEGEEAVLGGRRVPFRIRRREGEVDAVEIAGRVVRVRVIRQGERVLVWCGGRVFELEKATRASSRETGGDLRSPMPGRVRQVLVGVGDPISRGQVVLILEAMKMEHAIRAPRDGVVAAIGYKKGDLVDAGVRLAEIT